MLSGHSVEVRARKAPNTRKNEREWKHLFHSLLVKISDPVSVGANLSLAIAALRNFCVLGGESSLTKNWQKERETFPLPTSSTPAERIATDLYVEVKHHWLISCFKLTKPSSSGVSPGRINLTMSITSGTNLLFPINRRPRILPPFGPAQHDHVRIISRPERP